MKRVIAILVVVALTFIIIRVNAQGRGHGHSKHKDKHEWKHHPNESSTHSHSDRYSYDGKRTHDHRVVTRDAHTHTVRHYPVYSHHHSRHCNHHVIVRHQRPRYVYYDEHDLYYDHQRNVYISYTGRGWNISTSIPVHLHHVNLRSAVAHEVNYYDDNFITYLDTGRPMYGNVYYARR
jgi:hypothetical protein